MIVVDIGANKGDFVRYCLSERQVSVIHAIDPIAANCRFLRDTFAAEISRDRVVVHEGAVSLSTKETVSFNVSTDTFAEVSSLLDVSDFVDSDPYWATREDLHKFSKIDVNNMFVRDLPSRLKFSDDDVFLKVDAQGLDVDIWDNLQRNVAYAVVEVSASAWRSLYKNSSNSLEELVRRTSTEFEVYDVLSNDPNADELNVFLIKRGKSEGFLHKLVYDQNSFFAEKRNWVSSSEMNSSVRRVTELDLRISELDTRVKQLEDRNIVLEARNAELERALEK